MEEKAMWLFLHQTHSDFPFFLPLKQDFILPELFPLYTLWSYIKRDQEENGKPENMFLSQIEKLIEI